jgi:hypothetical protein
MKSPSLFISPQVLAEHESANRKAALDHSKSARIFTQPIGVERVTAIRLASPKEYRPIEALTYLQNAGVLALDRGEEWLVELTFLRLHPLVFDSHAARGYCYPHSVPATSSAVIPGQANVSSGATTVPPSPRFPRRGIPERGAVFSTRSGAEK